MTVHSLVSCTTPTGRSPSLIRDEFRGKSKLVEPRGPLISLLHIWSKVIYLRSKLVDSATHARMILVVFAVTVSLLVRGRRCKWPLSPRSNRHHHQPRNIAVQNHTRIFPGEYLKLAVPRLLNSHSCTRVSDVPAYDFIAYGFLQ